jgi:hypothetical protein
MGKLIISYDCEGIWGMLDKLDSLDESTFNRTSIVDLYKKIVRLHEDHHIQATFAFVGAFISTKSEFYNARKDYQRANAINNWCAKLDSVECKFSEQDIHIPELLNIVKSSEVDHEIATHGYSHVIMSKELDELSLKFELEGIKKTSESKNLDISTIIFPRNVVNYNLLDRADYIHGFRAPPRQISSHITIQRAFSLLKEFWPICRSENFKMCDNKTVIPGDFFINWRSGLRKFVPIWLTILRFRFALKHACKHDGVVHIWLHPHNLLTGKDQFKLLNCMLSVANEYRSNDSLKVLTQKDCIVSSNNL